MKNKDPQLAGKLITLESKLEKLIEDFNNALILLETMFEAVGVTANPSLKYPNFRFNSEDWSYEGHELADRCGKTEIWRKKIN